MCQWYCFTKKKEIQNNNNIRGGLKNRRLKINNSLHSHSDLNDHHIYHQLHLIESRHDSNFLETLRTNTTQTIKNNTNKQKVGEKHKRIEKN